MLCDVIVLTINVCLRLVHCYSTSYARTTTSYVAPAAVVRSLSTYPLLRRSRAANLPAIATGGPIYIHVDRYAGHRRSNKIPWEFSRKRGHVSVAARSCVDGHAVPIALPPRSSTSAVAVVGASGTIDNRGGILVCSSIS